MKMTKTLSFLMTGLMACAAQATDYYVSTEGDDANDGLTAATWCDVISVNAYVNSVAVFTDGSYAAPKFDKPVLHSEFHFGTLHRGMFSAGLCPVGDQCERARNYRRVVEGALRHPYFVGSHWFQYRDQPLVGRGDGENYQIGFVDVCDRPYLALTRAVREVAEKMYELRYAQ